MEKKNSIKCRCVEWQAVFDRAFSLIACISLRDVFIKRILHFQKILDVFLFTSGFLGALVVVKKHRGLFFWLEKSTLLWHILRLLHHCCVVMAFWWHPHANWRGQGVPLHHLTVTKDPPLPVLLHGLWALWKQCVNLQSLCEEQTIQLQAPGTFWKACFKSFKGCKSLWEEWFSLVLYLDSGSSLVVDKYKCNEFWEGLAGAVHWQSGCNSRAGVAPQASLSRCSHPGVTWWETGLFL